MTNALYRQRDVLDDLYRQRNILNDLSETGRLAMKTGPLFQWVSREPEWWPEDASPSTLYQSHLNPRVIPGETETTIQIEVPGVEPSDVKVKIEGKSLIVDAADRGSCYLTLGQRLDPEAATATLKHGLLTVRIPKRESRIVEVVVSEG